VRYLDRGNINAYGYTYLGEESDGYKLAGSDATLDPPFEPLTAAAYVQTRYEYKDLILNLGARYEYYDSKFKSATSKPNPVTGELDYTDIEYDYNLGIIDETQIVESDPISYVMPRVSFSFPVSDMTVFYAQYGKFAQMPALNTFYQNSYDFSQRVAPPDRSPYSFGAGASFQVLPERTTLFEAGIRQILTDNLAFTLTGFYRDTRQQIQVRPYYNSQGNRLFTSYQNVDFGTVKGVEMTLDLRRTARLSFRLNYTLSDAKGTGSSATSGRVSVTDETRARLPEFIVRMPFNQTHNGSMILDYRFARGDGGPVLEGMGLNFILSFNSGHNYTKLAEPQNLGQANPWNIGVRASIDPRTSNPDEPVSGSTTPWVFLVDMNWNKVFYIGDFNLELYVHVINLLDSKEIIDVFPTTGTAQDDGWLKSPFSQSYKEIENYEDFYRAINLDNRWALMGTVGDVYTAPRQIRLGLKLEF
jgi:outer membrane receptor protein involved in Fe transport